MNGKREGSEDTTMQQYPSPSVEVQEGGDAAGGLFQSSCNPSGTIEGQQAQSQSTESTNSPASQDLHQPQAQQPNSMSNAEELQLAAQLSQDLSAMPPLAPEEDATSAPPQPSTDQQIQHNQPAAPTEHQASGPQLDQQQSLPNNHEQQTHQHQQQAQSIHTTPQTSQVQHSQPAPALVSTHIQIQRVQPAPQTHIPVAPRPRPQAPQAPPHPQPSQYAQDHHQPVLAPQLSPLDPHQLAAQYAAAAVGVDNTPPRKRSKVSRACDECRRKKVKCDAQSETGDEPCSNCRRSNIQCLFSRVPQKRGPSKGYIKELADRINHIEGKLGSGAVRELMGSIGTPGAEAALAQSSLETNDRKRPYASISSDTVTQLASWTPERPAQTFETPRLQQPYHPDSLATPPSLHRPVIAEPKPATEDAAILESPGIPRDVDENSFLRYLSTVHPYLPFLPSTKAKLVTELAKAPATIGQAFIDAFHLAMGVLTTPTPDLAAVLRDIMEWEISRSKATSASDLIHVQTLLLAAISAENAGPHPDSPLTATSFLRKATDIIFSTHGMRPYFKRPNETPENDADPDNEHALWNRTWWSLAIMDRFSCVAWASPLAVPSDYVTLLPSHKPLLGETAYYLAGLAEKLGNMSPMIHLSTDVWNVDHPSVSVIRSTGTLLVDSWRQALPDNITPTTHPFVHAAYWHTKVIGHIASFASPFNDPSKAHRLHHSVSNLVQSLSRSPQLSAPYMHHFASLASLAIVELSKVPELRGDANELASQLLGANLAVGAWAGSIRHAAEYAKDMASGPLAAAAQSTASQSLQHLADLATTGLAVTGDRPEVSAEDDRSGSVLHGDGVAEQFNPFLVIESGYLNTISRLTPEPSSTG